MRGWSPQRVAAAANAELLGCREAGDHGVITNAGGYSTLNGECPCCPGEHHGEIADVGGTSGVSTNTEEYRRSLDKTDGCHGPTRVIIDSRIVEPGDLFIALPGIKVDGGEFAEQALRAGAWGVLTTPSWGETLSRSQGHVLVADNPLEGLANLARSWRAELGANVIGVTGSVGKTSTKDLIAALIRPHKRVVASRQNFNTEIGVPLEILAAPHGTEVLVLELAARGFGQIAELARICTPDVGVITAIAPVHLEQFGSLEGVARVKGELLENLGDGTHAVVPVEETRLLPYIHSASRVSTFGIGGDIKYRPDGDVRSQEGGHPERSPSVESSGSSAGSDSISTTIDAHGTQIEVELPFSQEYQLRNTLAAVGAALAVGVRPFGRVDVKFSALRGEQIKLSDGVTVINDCYNASPIAMQAALNDFAKRKPLGRRIAVLGDMLELGPDERRYHREVGTLANESGVEALITVGDRAAAMLDTYEGERYPASDADAAAEILINLLGQDDLILIKGSRGMGLEAIGERLQSAPDKFGSHGSQSLTAGGR